jgi:hypothetical protein
MKSRYVAILVLALCQFQAAIAATNAFDAAQLDYNLNTTVRAYEQSGIKNPKWDADAKACLTLFARVRSWTNGTPDALMDELRTALVSAGADGCEDPLVRYLHLRFVEAKVGTDDVSDYTEAASALQKSGYPDIRRFYAAAWVGKALRRSGKQAAEAAAQLKTAASFLANALDDPAIPPREADQACDFLMSAPWWAEPLRWDLYGILEPALANRWKGSHVAFLTKGEAELSHAWQARGTGYANSVSDNGWKEMEKRLETAAQSLEAAWKLDPRDARTCQEMMRVELGQNEGRARLELWFQRGMKIDPADAGLCREKLEYLRPRWYGSTEEMIKFGRECTENTNWAGEVRLMLPEAHYEAAQEIQDNSQRGAYWRQPKVWSDIHYAFEQYFKLYPEAVSYRQNYARYAVRCGEPQEFLNQVSMFASTNYSYFGGVEQFNKMMQWAKQQPKSQ